MEEEVRIEIRGYKFIFCANSTHQASGLLSRIADNPNIDIGHEEAREALEKAGITYIQDNSKNRGNY